MTDTQKHSTTIRNQLLEARVSALETRLNLLESDYKSDIQNLRQQLSNQAYDQDEHEPLFLPLHPSPDQNLVFVKIPSICNTRRTTDLRVQCCLTIQGHHLDL